MNKCNSKKLAERQNVEANISALIKQDQKLRGGVVRAFDNDEPSISDFSDTPPASDQHLEELEAALKSKKTKGGNKGTGLSSV